MKTKTSLILLITFLLPVIAISQPALNKKEMQEDFKFLIKTIENVDPQIAVIQYVTDKDVASQIRSLYADIDTITSFASFYKLVQLALHLTQDGHNNVAFCDDGSCGPNNSYITDSTQAIDRLLQKKMKEDYANWRFRGRHLPGIYYIKGDYFFIQDIKIKENNRDSILFEKGSRVLAINGINIDEYVAAVSEKEGSSISWDATRKKYYTKDDMRVKWSQAALLTIEMPDKQIINKELPGNVRIYYKGIAIPDEEQPKVSYFFDASILYIRIPEMDTDYLPFYIEEITNTGEKSIKKVVLDIRGNTGGSDKVWKEILSVIINKPILTHDKLLVKNTSLTNFYLADIRGITLPVEKEAEIIGRDTLFYLYNEIDSITPAANTIAYPGNIYILADEQNFSAAGSLLSISNNAEHLITIGQPTGNINGRGINPFFFSLPNSKLTFRLIGAIEGINSDNIADYYHNHIDILIEKSLQDILTDSNWPKDKERYTESYLKNHDPVFQKVLEQ